MKHHTTLLAIAYFLLPLLSASAQSNVMPSLPATVEGFITDPPAESLDARRYQDCPVSHASGSVDVNVPLISFPCGELSVALGLSYHTGGNQADYGSGRMGLGWMLTGLPQISRQIIGLADELRNTKVTEGSDKGIARSYAQNIINGKTDSFYDIYSYDIPGYAGSFYLKTRNDSVCDVIKLPSNGVIITPKPVEKKWPSPVRAFYITTPEGVEYEFASRDTVAVVTTDPLQKEPERYDGAVSAWNVTRIRAIGSRDTVNIAYSPAEPYYIFNDSNIFMSEGLVFEDDKPTDSLPEGELPARTGTWSYVRTHLPRRITCRTATVDFHTRDFGADWVPLRSQITYIDGITLSDRSDRVIRRATLCYTDTVDRLTVDDNFHARLSEVAVHAGDTLVSRHRFSYHGAWPKHFAPADGDMTSSGVPPYNMWNRNYLREKSGPWYLLNRIEDARGCVTRFVYESKSCDDASGHTLYKGQRISSIITKDTVTGRERRRDFTYSNPVLSVDIAGLPESAWRALTGVRRIVRSSTREQNVLIALGLRSPRAPGVDLKSPVIYYSDVVEETSGTGIDKPLRTSWSYDLTPVIHTVKTGLGTRPPVDGNNSMGRYMGRFVLTGDEPQGSYFGEESFKPCPLDFYVERNYGGSPLLTKRVEYEWNGMQYVPLETETRKWSIHRRDGDTRVTGVHCEPLVYQTDSSGGAVSPYNGYCSVVVKDPLTDVSAFDVRSTAYHWLCDTIVTRRHYPDGHSRDLTTIIGYDDPGDAVKSDTCSRSVFVSSLPMTVTRICDGQRIETSRLYSGNITTDAYDRFKKKGYRTLPVIERVVSGHDTLDTRYEYGIFNGMPRLTRQYTSRGNYRSPLEQVIFKAYDNYGRPTSGISKDGVSVSWEWEAQSDYLKEQRSGRWQITSFTSLPLTGYTSITSSSGKVRHYELKGGRIVTERNAAGDILSRHSYGLYATDGENFQVQETRSGSYSFARERVSVDGFGMPWLTVNHGEAGSRYSICRAVAYDALDRVTASTVPTSLPDRFIETGLLDYEDVRQSSNKYPDYRNIYPGHSGDTPAESYAPGNDYGQPTSVARLCNNTSTPMLQCHNYSVVGNMLVHNGDRNAGTLDVSRVTDPDGRVTLKFTDWRGLTVLERRMPWGAGGGGFLDTYYIHDNLGNLQAVLMPEAIKPGEHASLKYFDSDPALKDHAWLYVYNAEGRLSEKRVPGAGTVSYRYDRDGRLAFTQDAEERLEGSCRFYLYDNAGREVVTGLYTASLMPSDSKTAPAAIASLIANPGQSIENTGYWSNAIRTDDAEVLTARYYDNRAFASYAGFRDIPGVADVKARPGMLMAVTERVLGSAMQPAGGEALPKFVHAVYDYDDEERCVKAHFSTVRSGEYLTVATVYDVAGNALAVSNTLSHPDGTVDRETTTCQYDGLGRPVRRISSHGRDTGTLVGIHYDKLGRPYCTEGAGGTVNYTYDHLSRLSTIVTTDFEEHLTYSAGGLISRRRTFYPGRESETRVYNYDDASRLTSVQQIVNPRPNSQSIIPEAAYIYDRNSNATAVVRHRRVSDIPAGAPTYHYDEVDNLTMTYQGNRLVKVTDSADHPTDSKGYDFHDGADDADEYTYDLNGRLTSDLNRGIAAIEWNAASQPLSIRLDGGERLEYTYSASGERLGERLCRIVNASGQSLLSPSSLAETEASGGSLRTPPMPHVVTISSRRFVGPFELEGDSVTRVNVAGGYWNADGLHGYVADWQGNIRTVRRGVDGRTVQTNSYYPYGLPIESESPTVNPYKFSAKEFETRHGLNFSHHGARLMLNDLTRFATPDPLAEVTPGVSPYTYCLSDPINYNDLMGYIPSPLEGAVLVAHCYGDYKGKLIGGWEQFGSVLTFPFTSFRAVQYRRMTDNGYEYAFAMAGTFFEATTRGVISIANNFLQVFGLSPDIYISKNVARSFVREHPNSVITFLGHSKSGAQAAACALATNRTAITYNPAALFYECYSLSPSNYSDVQGVGIVNYVLGTDVVDLLNKLMDAIPVGTVIHIESDNGNPIDNHLIESVIEQLEKNE